MKKISMKKHKEIGKFLCDMYDNTSDRKIRKQINEFRGQMDEDLFRDYGYDLISVYYNDKQSIKRLARYKK